jgi:hypothetical protein
LIIVKQCSAIANCQLIIPVASPKIRRCCRHIFLTRNTNLLKRKEYKNEVQIRNAEKSATTTGSRKTLYNIQKACFQLYFKLNFMYQIFTNKVAGANNCSAMGRETIQKSRVSPKNDKNRRNYYKCLLLICVYGIVLSSCVTSSYYQVYKIQPTSEVKQSGNSLVYEDENCKVFYDFWGEGGDVGFLIYNKSDKDILVDMKESFFISNGIAYDYFKNREFTSFNSTSQSSMYSYSASNTYSAIASIIDAIAVSGYNYQGFKQTNSVAAGLGAGKSVTYGASAGSNVSNTSSRGVSIKEKDIIYIPSKSAKVISEYNINENLYRDCNLFLKPSKKQIKTSDFMEENSPFVFSNRITYLVDGQSAPVKIEQHFFVSEITNYPEKEIIELKIIKNCEDEIQSTKKGIQITKKDEIKITKKEKFFKDISPDKFYIRYDTGSYLDEKH